MSGKEMLGKFRSGKATLFQVRPGCVILGHVSLG